MDKLSLKLEKVKGKVDIKMILTLLNAVMGVIRTLLAAKQEEGSAI